MQRAPSTESNSVPKRSPSLMAATAVLPLLTPAERRALQFSPTSERDVYEHFPLSSSSSSSSPAPPSSGIMTMRDLTSRINENAIHDPNWQVYTNLPYSTGRSGNNALTKATKDLIALQPPPTPDYASHTSSGAAQSPPLTAIANGSGTKASGRSVRSNSSGSVNVLLAHASATATTANTNGNHHHHRPIAPAPPANVSKHSRASTDTSSFPSAKRLRRSLSPSSHQLTVGMSNSHPSYTSSSMSSALTGPSSSSVTGLLSPLTPPPLPAPPQHGNPSSSKAALLTPQQKKANHIQSEQKRRANIRRGYEALCDTIPALREAIRAEEEMNHVQSNDLVNGLPRKRRSREETGEKVDGRAGPRSESVVLQKTIEHIQGLLCEKDALLSRLERASAILGPSHPALDSDDSLPRFWERAWDGGKGLMVVNGEVLHGSDEE